MKLKKYITEKNLLYSFIGVLIITTIADVYTALSSPVFEIAEANPIYLLTGSVVPLLVMTVFITIWFARNLTNSISIGKIFMFCMLTIYLSVGHGFGVWSNITATNQYQENPEEYIENIEVYEVKDKVTAYFILVGIVMMLPIVVSLIAFTIAMYFYEKRQPKRDKIVDKICGLTKKLMSG